MHSVLLSYTSHGESLLYVLLFLFINKIPNACSQGRYVTVKLKSVYNKTPHSTIHPSFIGLTAWKPNEHLEFWAGKWEGLGPESRREYCRWPRVVDGVPSSLMELEFLAWNPTTETKEPVYLDSPPSILCSPHPVPCVPWCSSCSLGGIKLNRVGQQLLLLACNGSNLDQGRVPDIHSYTHKLWTLQAAKGFEAGLGRQQLDLSRNRDNTAVSRFDKGALCGSHCREGQKELLQIPEFIWPACLPLAF